MWPPWVGRKSCLFCHLEKYKEILTERDQFQFVHISYLCALNSNVINRLWSQKVAKMLFFKILYPKMSFQWRWYISLFQIMEQSNRRSGCFVKEFCWWFVSVTDFLSFPIDGYYFFAWKIIRLLHIGHTSHEIHVLKGPKK